MVLRSFLHDLHACRLSVSLSEAVLSYVNITLIPILSQCLGECMIVSFLCDI